MPTWPPVGYPYVDGSDIIFAEIVHDIVAQFDAVGSAYDIALSNGFVGTEQQWLDSLKGEDGDPGSPGTNGVGVVVINSNEGAGDVPPATPSGSIILKRPAP